MDHVCHSCVHSCMSLGFICCCSCCSFLLLRACMHVCMCTGTCLTSRLRTSTFDSVCGRRRPSAPCWPTTRMSSWSNTTCRYADAGRRAFFFLGGGCTYLLLPLLFFFCLFFRLFLESPHHIIAARTCWMGWDGWDVLPYSSGARLPLRLYLCAVRHPVHLRCHHHALLGARRHQHLLGRVHTIRKSPFS